MKSVPKLIRRYVGILLMSCILLLMLNFILLVVFAARQTPNAYPWKTAKEVADALWQTQDGTYILPDLLILELKESDAWAIFIDDETKQVKWHTDNLPETIPVAYTISDIAALTRGYLDGYPTFTGESENGLIVLGYPKTKFWKHMWPSWDYELIANLPRILLNVFAINAVFIFLIYVIANAKLLNSIKPIVNGIQSLPLNEPVHIKEKGLLSELALNINETSEILQSQNKQLELKESARANWIAGVSHDIRTPLSMVMGYACQLRDDAHLTEEERAKAQIIVKQSERIRNLINDLNLASKLEYNMQPANMAKENIVAVVRQVVVDFINIDMGGRYPIEWETEYDLTSCFVNADRDLVKRAIGNLIWNCINHNEQGCKIHAGVAVSGSRCIITVEDDGAGASDEQIEKLNNAPHYMVCDENTTKQRHGLGLLIVKQITAVHGGTAVIGHSPYGGFSVKIILPVMPVNPD